ncbi:LytTR family DNA-binding domain-containing protein [Chryseolinea sp. H1M3-3]|uniref:LytR/AlgR family response regulator transcription factor n=1 Tax=Chryseolinea sp. H1M3-3 TaxID=3034144 RepID=UPI0023EBAE15|nr:LytTR family DNA-binding domain-containing protein [Chryseolinea sp. H1M3-3]
MIQGVLIIEDEPHAAQRLVKLMEELVPGVKILGKIDSVKKSVQWIVENPTPDLIFMDIQLADGISFQIFDQCDVKCPVIFTTAYDAYALKAFKVNSIDYILKPVDKDDLEAAFRKLNSLTSQSNFSHQILASIGDAVKTLTRKHKTRFVIKVGEHLKSIEVSDIQYFFSLEKTTFAKVADGRKHILDITLDQLEDVLDPLHFFRINRKYIISPGAIQDMISHTNSRIKLVLKGSDDADIIVARERVQEFKDWLDQ